MDNGQWIIGAASETGQPLFLRLFDKLFISPTAFVFFNKNYQELPKIFQKLLLREIFD